MKSSSNINISSHISEIIKEIFILCKHLSLYSEDNLLIKTTTDKLLNNIRKFNGLNVPIVLTVAKYNFLAFGEPLDPKSQLFRKFAYRMFQHGISSFSITPDLTVPSLYSFLRLLSNHPAKTWDQGGIVASLEQFGVVGIEVTEMAKSDFLLAATSKENQPLEKIQSSEEFWNRFAQSLICALSGTNWVSGHVEKDTPKQLAEKVNELVSGEEPGRQEILTQELSRSITAAQGQRINKERKSTFLKLADFVNHLNNESRKNVLQGICNLHLLKGNAEDFFNGFSDEVILDAFRQVTLQKDFKAPVIMSLITKLAGEKKLVSDQDIAALVEARDERIEKVKELLSPDAFDKYVPPRYQQTLREVLAGRVLPTPLSRQLKEIKRSLEGTRLEEKSAKLAIHILNNNPDPKYLEGLHRQLAKSLEFYLGGADYSNLVNLCRLCFKNRTENETADLIKLIPETFFQQLLKDSARMEKRFLPLVTETIVLLGPGIIRPLLDWVNKEKDRTLRYLFLNCVREIGLQIDVSEIVAGHLQDEHWYVVRNMLMLLGQVGAKDKLPQIRAFLKHDHLRVRQEALKACLSLNDHTSVNQLRENLFSKNRQEVLQAITMSQVIEIPEVSRELLKMLAGKKLFSFDFDVNKALVHALAKQQNKQALAIFADKLNSSHMFQARVYQKFKIEIIKALQNYPRDRAVPLLEKQIKKGRKDLANEAQKVMNHLLSEESAR